MTASDWRAAAARSLEDITAAHARPAGMPAVELPVDPHPDTPGELDRFITDLLDTMTLAGDASLDITYHRDHITVRLERKPPAW